MWNTRPLGSLPLAFGLRDPALIPGTAGYVRLPPSWRVPPAFEALRQDAGTDSRPRVGLCWAGNPELAHDKSRSLTLASLTDLIAGHDLSWVSLQKQRSGSDAELLRELGVLDLSTALGDFTDTAAVIALAIMAARTGHIDALEPLAERARALDAGCGEAARL